MASPCGVSWLMAAAMAFGLAAAARAADAPPALPAFDFTRAEEARGWQPAHDIAGLQATPEGLAIDIGGADPYAIGPPRDFPADLLLWVRIRLKSDEGGSGQVFYFKRGAGATEEKSVRFPASPGEWTDVRLPLPALGPATCFRIDPPGAKGRAIVAYLKFEPRALFAAPAWPKPAPPDLSAEALAVRSGDLALRHGRGLGHFEVQVAGQPMAVGLTRSLLGYVQGDAVRWASLADATAGPAEKQGDATTLRFALRDPDGATWQFAERFAPGTAPGAIDVQVSVTVDRPRETIFLPMFFLVPGAGSFGAEKGQGLFAGLEYLDDEPSSSEADVRGPGAMRQVPDTAKITMPLAAIQARDRYVGLAWEPDGRLAAVFDSPDRLLGTGGHIMGLLFPGSDGKNRQEGNLLAYAGERLAPGAPLVLRATIIGGRGKSVVAAVEQFVRLRGLAPMPATGLDWQGYVGLAGGGWLDSKIREGSRFRHAAWPGNFPAQPAADAAVMMDYLAAGAKDAALAARLREAAKAAIAEVQPRDYYHSGVSHVRYPVAPLVYGGVAEAVAAARASARGNLKAFQPDGSLPYRAAAGKPDYGSTHFSKEANGLASGTVLAVLRGAAFSGDRELLGEGLRVLRAMDKFADTVPRGAQTWEMPLHTPDVLASAHLVHAYTLGYELSGDAKCLDLARSWAWTGVPFLYAWNPTGREVGPYAAIAVLGATNWQAPLWIGQPVQWCGMVYADALRRLALHAPEGRWNEWADGIAAAGIQITWKRDDAARQGLLPDGFQMRGQHRDGPAINPGTIQAVAAGLYRQLPMYDFRSVGAGRALVHAPGAIEEAKEDGGRVSFRVRPWPRGAYWVLVSGLAKAPSVRINGKEAAVAEPHEYLATGNLILRLEGETRVELGL